MASRSAMCCEATVLPVGEPAQALSHSVSAQTHVFV
jgi:hypothetical protein